MFFVYVIYNRKNDKFYVGSTKDLKERVELHNNRVFPQSYTARFDGEWELAYSEKFETLTLARNREKQLKSYRGREFVKTKLPR